MRIYRQTVQKDGQSITVKRWYTDVRIDGKRYRLPLFEKEETSRNFAESLETMIGQHEAGRSFDKYIELWLTQIPSTFLQKFSRWGLIESTMADGGKPIQDHVEDYITYLDHKGNTPPYCALCKTRLEKVIEGCGFRTLPTLASAKVMRYLSDELTAKRISQGTFNHYVRQWKGFLRWLWREDRMKDDLSKSLSMRTVTSIEKDRRALSIAEITYLLDWVSAKGVKAYGLTGPERALLYRIAITTGLRVNELRALKACSINFQTKTVSVPSGCTKNRREAVLPLREDVLEALRERVSGKPKEEPLFKITDKTANMLRKDMAGAKAAYVKEGQIDKIKKQRETDDFLKVNTADGEVDFHSLRHSFGSLLAASGVSPAVAKELMRHSTITLTMNIYTHVLGESETAAVAKLPSFDKTTQKNQKKA